LSLLDDWYNLTGVRYPAEQKAETHEKILAAAARSFREHGSDINGIGRVMKELGLTKGGFYRHFDSKGDLYAEAVARAFQQMGDWLVAVAKAAPKGQGLRAIIENYLSHEHLNRPGTGCALAALGPEISRQPVKIRERIAQTLLAFGDRLSPYLPGRTPEEKRGCFIVLFPGMAGVLVTARALPDSQRQERVLATARSFYIKAFATEGGA
jgi:TetR/AcrR family transcriptional regulator, transcriptional repressor for nem operon